MFKGKKDTFSGDTFYEIVFDVWVSMYVCIYMYTYINMFTLHFS